MTHSRKFFSRLLTLSASALLLAGAASAQTPVGSSCTKSSCYSAFDQHPLTFSTSLSHCQARGGDLASIADAAENTDAAVAVDYCQDTGKGWPEALIGLNDIASEGNFVWSDGSPVTYTNWAPTGQPDNMGGQDWVELRGSGANYVGAWDDTKAGRLGTPRCFLCEHKVTWQPSSGGLANLPANAFAYNEGYICQAWLSGLGQTMPGRLTDGGCALSNVNQIRSSGYNVLVNVAAPASLSWQLSTGPEPANAVVGGDDYQENRYLCRIPGVGAGTTYGDNKCRVRVLPTPSDPADQFEFAASGFEILVFHP